LLKITNTGLLMILVGVQYLLIHSLNYRLFNASGGGFWSQKTTMKCTTK
jgi:hypothetical protein